MSLLQKFFKPKSQRDFQRHSDLLEEVKKHAVEYQGFSPEQFRAKTDEFRRRVQEGASTDDLLPEAFGLVKAAFQKLNARETHTLRVSPQDAATLEQHRARLNFPEGLEIARDPSLPKGSAVFETSRGELDASIDTQLAEIGRGLTDLMQRQTS